MKGNNLIKIPFAIRAFGQSPSFFSCEGLPIQVCMFNFPATMSQCLYDEMVDQAKYCKNEMIGGKGGVCHSKSIGW